jgi:prepilin-type N-terminal cleavage/methylation domain-containing protein
MNRREGKRGFTLFEILVAVSLIGLVGSIIVGSFAHIMRGATKAQFLKRANDNGVYVIDLVAKDVRNAQEILTCADNNLRIQRNDEQGSTVEYLCETDGDGRSTIKKDGGEIIEDDFTLDDCTVFVCSGSPTETVVTNFYLEGWDSAEKVKISKGEKGLKTNFSHRTSVRNY